MGGGGWLYFNIKLKNIVLEMFYNILFNVCSS